MDNQITENKRDSVGSVMMETMKGYFLELDKAAKSRFRKIAWCTSIGPAELLHSMGFLVYFPENHGPLLGLSRTSGDLMLNYTAEGFSRDVRVLPASDSRPYFSGKIPSRQTYGLEIPLPDVLVYNSNQNRDVKDWFTWYAQKLKKPILEVITPSNIGDIKDDELSGISQQLRDMIPTLEKVSGNKFDEDRLKETVALSRQSSELWEACLQTSAFLPSPWSFFDQILHMGPAIVLRGTNEAVDYYNLLLKDLQKKIKVGFSAVEHEALRIYWDGMPIWGKLRGLEKLFRSMNSCVVASTYCNSWVYNQFDEDDPFKGMARAFSEFIMVRDDDYKEFYIKNMFRNFRVNGMIHFDAKTCPNKNSNRFCMPEGFSKKLGISTLTLTGDLHELYFYNEKQTVTKIEAFIEQLMKWN